MVGSVEQIEVMENAIETRKVRLYFGHTRDGAEHCLHSTYCLALLGTIHLTEPPNLTYGTTLGRLT